MNAAVEQAFLQAEAERQAELDRLAEEYAKEQIATAQSEAAQEQLRKDYSK